LNFIFLSSFFRFILFLSRNLRLFCL
jgi:hypothetical protein